MKKILSCLLIFAMLISCCMPVLANEDKVEISFCIGDDTLIINGTPVTVEKPYVVGEGVTLVPVRVITEAFDAKVDWIGETQSVRLTYPDVNILIQIGNPVAEINGRAETLLAPPEISVGGFTMVPLRFISENFGADVSYDNETQRITVTKVKAEEAVSIEGAVTNKYIGDSYYGWSMENPMDMALVYRSFDGAESYFSDGDNEISIEIYTYDPEDYDFENHFVETKMGASNLTLVNTQKDDSNKDCKTFRVGAKDKNYYYDCLSYVTPDYVYAVFGTFSNEDATVRDQYLDLVSTFKCKFEGTDIYDMSSIKDGFRTFESEHLKLSFDVPENFYMASSEDSQNRFEFYESENGISSIIAVVYSKSDAVSAQQLATDDYNHNKAVLNEELATFSKEPSAKQYSNISAVEYSYDVKSDSESFHKRDVFFEVGDYVYNLGVSIELPSVNYEDLIDKIIESIKAEPLDSKEVGVLMKNLPVATGITKAKLGKFTMELPNTYIDIGSDDTAIAYIGPINGVVASCAKVQDATATTADLRTMLKTLESGVKDEDGTILKATHDKTINGLKFLTFRAKTEAEDDVGYAEIYACLYKGSAYIITIGCSELTYSKATQTEINNIVESIKFE